jgi:parallel beta-helix repeat protein
MEPNTIENGHYKDGHYYDPIFKPPTGTHVNIENRDLNEVTEIFYDEVAGAMGWYLGSLDPNESVSITVAFMFGHGPVHTTSLEMEKYNDVDSDLCTKDDPFIYYTITYGNPVTVESDPNYLGDVENVIITDYLPDGIDPNNVEVSDDGIYDPQTNTIIWDIGTLEEGDVGVVTVTIKVLEFVESPLGRVTNTAVLTSDVGSVKAIDVTDLHPIILTKEDNLDDVECVEVRGEIEYAVHWKYWWNDPVDPNSPSTPLNPNSPDPNNPIPIHPELITIVDYLPDEVDLVGDYNDPNDEGLYDPATHSITWYLDTSTLQGGDEGTFEFTVTINNKVVPGGVTTNLVTSTYTIEGYERSCTIQKETEVCDCSETKIIYVDENAEGAEDGSSWDDAFVYLDEALAYARACGDQIWVAAGTYSPDGYSDPNATFKLVNNVSVYGGFPTGGGDWQERNWTDNETILSGDVSSGIYSVVTAENIDSAILDGFTIENGLVEGILCANASPTIEHNRIKQNGWGLFSKGNNSTPTIKNNWIYQNQEDGIYLENGFTTTLIRNNTIADNAAYGIYVESGDSPDVRNCIIWGHPDPNDVQGCTTHYCIVEADGHDNPDFLTGTENYHIDTDSPCVDAGDPNGNYSFERDIDGQFRIIGNTVDIGADEACEDTYFSLADFNDDDIVNLEDYLELAVVWLEDTPPWDPNCDLNADDSIDMYDLDLFIDDWLWFSCSYNSPQPNMMMGRGGSGMKSMGLGLSSLTATSLTSKTKQIKIAHAVPQKMTLQKMVELVRWLDEIWLEEPEIRKEISQEEWKEFMRRVYMSFDYLD